MDFEQIILHNLSNNSEYAQQVNVHLKESFFDSFFERELFIIINKYIKEYKDIPTKSVIQHEITKSTKFNDTQYEEILKTLNSVFEKEEKQNIEWLVDETEKYCQKVSFENAIVTCFDLYKQDAKNKDSALEMMKEALSVQFDSDVGINFFDEDCIERRLEEYNKDLTLYRTGMEPFDTVCGGLKSKAVSVVMAPSGTGKTLAMISLIADALRKGHNVAYFTMEMSEEEISKRVEANLLGIEINDIKNTDKDFFKSELLKLKEQSYGKLMIREFPTGSANCLHFDKQLDDWKLKNNFDAEIIVADYLSIMSSIRIKDANSYMVVKAIIEEFRGLCVKRNVAGLTAIQTNREGMNSSNLNYTNVSDSVGVVFTADLIIGIISNEEMRQDGYQIWKILKNRNTGIIDFFFPVLTKFEFSRLLDASNEAFTNELLLNNNPETSLKIEKMRRNENKFIEKKIDGDTVLRKQDRAFDVIVNTDEKDVFDMMKE